MLVLLASWKTWICYMAGSISLGYVPPYAGALEKQLHCSGGHCIQCGKQQHRGAGPACNFTTLRLQLYILWFYEIACITGAL